MDEKVPAWATTPAVRDRLFVERIPASAGTAAAERWNVDSKPAYLVGRQAEAVDIPCLHKSASRVHACLAHRGEGLFLLDLGSVHGTFLSGQRLEERAEAEIRPGDSFRIAACPDAYRLVAVDGAAGAAPRPEAAAPATAAAVSPSQAAQDRQIDAVAPADRTREASASHARGAEHELAAEQAQRHAEASAHSSRQPGTDHHRRSDERRQPARPGDRHEDSRDGGGSAHGRHDSHGARNFAVDRGHGGSRDGHDGQRRNDDRRPAARDPDAFRRREDAVRSGTERRNDRTDDRRHGQRAAGSGNGSYDRRSSHRRSRSPGRKRHREHDAHEGRDDRQSRQEYDVGRAPDRPAPVSAAVKAAARQQAAAELVRQMGGVNGVPGQTLEQKKKLLWGAKKAESVQLAVDQGTAAGVNRWDGAEFTSEEDKAKFQKLMGVKQMPTAARRPEDQPAGLQHPQPEIFARDTQQRVLSELESQYLAGVKRGNKQTVGLGIL